MSINYYTSSSEEQNNFYLFIVYFTGISSLPQADIAQLYDKLQSYILKYRNARFQTYGNNYMYF